MVLSTLSPRRFLWLVVSTFLLISSNTTAQPVALCMKPNSVRLIPNASFQPNWFAIDANGQELPVSADIAWSSGNPAVVDVSSSGVFSAGSSLGETTVSATWHGLNFQTKVKVVPDFNATPAEKRVVKVAMIIIDPPIPAAGGQRFSERFWSYNGGPLALAQQTRDSMYAVSGGTVDYQFVEIHDEPNLLTTFGGTPLTVDSMYRLFLEPGWPTLHHVAEELGQSEFSYNDLLNKYDLCSKSNTHQVDEVWVWAMPFIGMGEAAMTGTGAFWINGPVISGNSCTDLLPIMGFNYERYAGCALHNFTHRIETTLYKVFDTSVRYTPADPAYPPGVPKDPLQTFMLYDALEPGKAQVGNSHFPPNGTENYDYDNLNVVPTYAPDWKRYPFLFDRAEPINCSAWGCEGDCGLNYCSWWMRHIPHFKCTDKTGILNNWWPYVIDYNEGKALEAQTGGCGCQMFADETAHCASKGEFPWHEWISRVKINDLDQASGKSQYTDFTGPTPHLAAGGSYTLSLSAGFSYFTYDEYFRVWLDLNQDGFLDENEKIAEGKLPKPLDGTPEATLHLALQVPAGTGSLQHVQMRISMKRGGYPTPCETIPFGEVEDYHVDIAGTVTHWTNLQVQNWAVPSGASPGQSLNSTFTLVNAGTLPVPGSFLVGAFLSPDDLWGPNDQLVASLAYPNLGIVTLAGQPLAITIPASVAPGNYFLILRADFANQIAELYEGDNEVIVPFTVTSGVPNCPSRSSFPWEDWIAQVKIKDLDHASGKSPYSDFTGQVLDVNAGFPVDVTLGTGFSYFTYDEYWKIWIDYNRNGIFEEATETFLSLTVPRPADGTPFYSANTTAFIQGGFSQDFTTKMRVAMKRGAYPAPCETFAFGEVEDYSIHIAPGGGQSRPDLRLVNFLAAASGAPGAVVPFTFDLKNGGTSHAIGDYTIGAYLSTDGQLSADDALVGTIQTGNTPIGTIPNVPGSLAIPASLAPGNYFLILKADIDNTIAELDELNNTISRPFLVTPVSGIGADLELTLSADQTSAPVYGTVTYTYTVKNTGNQPVANAVIFTGVCANAAGAAFSQATALVYAGVPAAPTVGGYNYIEQRWTIANLAPGQSGQLTIRLFTLSAAERKVVAFVQSQSPADPDSQPGTMPANCTPVQDDEAVWTINAGQNLPSPGETRGNRAPVAGLPDLQLYPNPAGDLVFLQSERLTGKPVMISLYNQLSVKVLENHVEEFPLTPLALDLSALHSGQYFLKVEAAGEQAIFRKLVVTQRN